MTEFPFRRRRFLAVVVTVAIAGCSDGGDGGESPTETPTPTTPNEEAVAHYDDAIDALVQNKETLDEWAASSFESDKVGTLQDRVSSARDDLDAAEAAADQSGTLIAQIDQARLAADFQELSLAYYEGVTSLVQVIDEAKNLGDNELHQRAADTFVDAQALLEDLRSVLDDMGTVLAEIDNDALDEPELEYTGEPLDHLDLEDRRAIGGVESNLVGYENIHLTFVQLENGQEHYENGEFSAAREEWETGRERAQQSKAAFEDAIDNDYTPKDQRQESITLLGVAETVIEAFDKFVEGATEAEAGNLEQANKLVGEGFNILGEL